MTVHRPAGSPASTGGQFTSSTKPEGPSVLEAWIRRFDPSSQEHLDIAVEAFAKALNGQLGDEEHSPMHVALDSMLRSGIQVDDPRSFLDSELGRAILEDRWTEEQSKASARARGHDPALRRMRIHDWPAAGFRPSEALRWRRAGVDRAEIAVTLRDEHDVRPETLGLQSPDGGCRIGDLVNDGKIEPADVPKLVRRSLIRSFNDEDSRVGF